MRLFVSWRVLEPQVGRYDEEALDRSEGRDRCDERGMRAIVCLFADDRHSELARLWGRSATPGPTPI